MHQFFWFSKQNGTIGSGCNAAIAAVDALLPLAGASAIYADNPIQRCSRDLHASSQHILFNADVLTDIGQVALGRTPTAPNF